MLNVASPGSVKAQTFFEDVCPILLRHRGALCQQLGGRYAFRLEGRGGGEWTLDFSELSIEARFAEGAHLRVWMRACDFEALIAGRLDGVTAIGDGRLRFAGERQLFASLAAFTAPEHAVD